MTDKNKIKLVLKELRQYWLANEVPNITDENAVFLQNLIAKNNFKNILEIWTANWYSTICFADILSDIWWKITSIEFSILSHNQAKVNINSAWLEKYVKLIHWQALDIIPAFEDNFFDFIFIDWMKRRSKDFLELSLPKIKKWWIIVIDDVIKFKAKMVWLYEFVEEKWFNNEIIHIDKDDGIMVIYF